MGKQYLIKLIKKFGYSNGFRIYKKLKNKHTEIISIPGYKSPFSIRPGTKDKDIFRHIILDEDYNINLYNNPKVIIDAGAYAGYSTTYFANKYKNAYVIAIEPDIDNYNILIQNTRPYKNIKPYNNALWYKKTKVGIQKNTDKCSISVDANFVDTTVDTITLEEIITTNNITSIDTLKMDIEGAEKELFENNPHSWLSITKVLIIELHDRKKAGCSKALFNALTNYEFSLSVKSEYLIIKK